MNLLAQIAEGETALSDILFLVAVIVFSIVAFMRFAARAVDAGLAAVGLAVLSLGWLLL